MKKSAIAILVFTLVLSILSLTSVNADAKVNYKKIYGKYLKKHPVETYDDLSYASGDWEGAFIYINKDNVPELIINGSSCAASCQLYTIKAGKVRKIDTAEGWAGGLRYVRKGSKYYTGGGRQNYYHEAWFTLKKGKAKKVADSTHDAWENSDYTWNESNVDYSTYQKNVNRLVGKSKYIEPHFKPFVDLGLVKYMR